MHREEGGGGNKNTNENKNKKAGLKNAQRTQNMRLLSVLVGNLELGGEQHPVVESSIFKLRLHWDK